MRNLNHKKNILMYMRARKRGYNLVETDYALGIEHNFMLRDANQVTI